MTNQKLYSDLPKITGKIVVRRMRLAGYCLRHPEAIAAYGRKSKERKETN